MSRRLVTSRRPSDARAPDPPARTRGSPEVPVRQSRPDSAGGFTGDDQDVWDVAEPFHELAEGDADRIGYTVIPGV